MHLYIHTYLCMSYIIYQMVYTKHVDLHRCVDAYGLR